MNPLIEIETVPIQLEIKVTPARLEYARGTADLQISRSEGGLQIQSKPIRLNLDTFQARDSIGTPASAASSIRQYAQKGQQAVYDATATCVRQGELLLKTKIGEELITQFAAEAMMKDYKPNVGIDFIPKAGPDVSWDKGAMTIHYEMDKLNLDWKINKNRFEFTPGNIEISVKQMPDITIKYLGGHIYVPPSSDPDYEPVDVKA